MPSSPGSSSGPPVSPPAPASASAFMSSGPPPLLSVPAGSSVSAAPSPPDTVPPSSPLPPSPASPGSISPAPVPAALPAASPLSSVPAASLPQSAASPPDTVPFSTECSVTGSYPDTVSSACTGHRPDTAIQMPSSTMAALLFKTFPMSVCSFPRFLPASPCRFSFVSLPPPFPGHPAAGSLSGPFPWVLPCVCHKGIPAEEKSASHSCTSIAALPGLRCPRHPIPRQNRGPCHG